MTPVANTMKFHITLPWIPYCSDVNIIVYACLIGVVEALVKTFI